MIQLQIIAFANKRTVVLLLLLLVCSTLIQAVTIDNSSRVQQTKWTCAELSPPTGSLSRRSFAKGLGIGLSAGALEQVFPVLPVFAYTPDSDPLRESLYFISRVQEATVQQERYISRATQQEELQAKMKLTLRLVEKNYRLLDQINYCSTFVNPKDAVVEATQAGYEAVDSLQAAIDYVRTDLGKGPMEDSQKTFLKESMQSCRENLFVFLKYMPQDKLEAARKRVEDENVANRDEFDGDKDAGVYNPVVLPWKQK